jgi:hypothetical protein
MRPVSVVEDLELAQRVEQMSPVEDQRPVEQLAPACPHPAFHHGIHPGNADAAAHDRDPGVGEDGVEQGRLLAVPITDEVLQLASRVQQSETVDLTPQDGDLMSQHEQFDVFRAAFPGELGQHLQDLT